MANQAPTVSLSQLSAVVDMLIKVKRLCPDMMITPIVHGMHGVGKTSTMAQIAEKHNMNLVTMHPAHSRLEDLIGLPHAEEYSFVDDDGVERKAKRTVYSQPPWIADVYRDPRPAIIFVDEFNRCRDLDVYNAMIPFLLEGRLDTHRIRKGDLIVSAANPDCAEYEVQAIGDMALRSRFAHFILEPERNEWTTWNTRRGDVHAAVIDVFTENVGLCPHVSVPKNGREMIAPDPRNVTRFGRVMHAVCKDGEQFDIASLTLLGYGLVGHDATNQFILKMNQLNEDKKRSLTIEAVLDGTAVGKLDTVKEVEKIVALNAALADAIVTQGERFASADAKARLAEWLLAINSEHLYTFVQALKAKWTGVEGNDATRGNNKAFLFMKSVSQDVVNKILRRKIDPKTGKLYTAQSPEAVEVKKKAASA